MSLQLKDQYDKIYKYCYFKVKNAYLAEDLTQETFLKYFSQNSYINRGKSLAYLYTIAKNLCIDAYRKAEMLSLDEASEAVSAQNEFDSFEVHVTVENAIHTLPQDLQEIILLRYINELSVLEICKITGLSRFAVHRKTKNALSKLKLVLREEDFS